MQDERRHVDRRDDVAHVDVERHAHECHRVPRRRRHHLQPAEPLLRSLRIRVVGKEVARREPFAPALGQRCHQRVELLRRGLAPGPVVRFRLLDLGAHEQQRLNPLRVGRREDHRHRPAFGDAQQHGALRAGGVQHRPRIVHAVVERADARSLGEAHPPLVEQDQPRERRELLAEAAVGRVLPELLEMGEGAPEPDDVRRPLAEHLVGDLDPAAVGVPHGRRAHEGSVSSNSSSSPSSLSQCRPTSRKPSRRTIASEGSFCGPTEATKWSIPCARAQSSSPRTASPA